MRNLPLKRWSSLLVAFALVLQIWTPALALEAEDETTTDSEVEAVTTEADDNSSDEADSSSEENTEDETSSEEETEEADDEEASDNEDTDLSEVDSSDAVEVLDDILDEQDDTDDEIDEIIDGLLDDVETQEEAEELIQDIEDDINDMIDDLEDEAQNNPALRAKIARKILRHKAFLLKLRAKAILRHRNLVGVIKQTQQGRKLYEVRWGVLNQSNRVRCPGLDRAAILSALESGETPDCDVVTADYEGSISVDKGTLEIKKEILFETNDSVTTESGSEIEWSSHIAGHWDGLLVEYTPEEDQSERANVTISIGTLNETFVGAESLGTKAIGDGHYVQIRPIAGALAGVADSVQDKLVENKVEIQDKIDAVKERLRKINLVRLSANDDVSSASDELEDLLEEIEEYNFDDLSTDEMSDEIEDVLTDVTTGANKSGINNRIQRLRGMFVSIKEKARERKYQQEFIPFKDTDDNEWYTKYVAPMKEEGIVSGYKDADGNEIGEYRPGNNVTVAEILKIGLETSSNGDSEGIPALAAAMNHWAKAYVKRAEELSLDIVGEDVDLNRPATRGEVIRMMLEAAGLEPDSVQGTSFSDVPASYKHAAYIALAKELGIVSGDDGTNTFRPNDPINRAEVAKIANQIMEILLGQ